MNKYIADTMALILRLEKRKMPERVKKSFEEAERENAQVLIPAVVFAELGYLSEKKKIDTNLGKARVYMAKHPGISEAPLNLAIVEAAFRIDDIPELHDRLIAATGKELQLPVLTNDPAIHASKHVTAIWK